MSDLSPINKAIDIKVRIESNKLKWLSTTLLESVYLDLVVFLVIFYSGYVYKNHHMSDLNE